MDVNFTIERPTKYQHNEQKQTTLYIIVKFQYDKNKEKVLKASRKKQVPINK